MSASSSTAHPVVTHNNKVVDTIFIHCTATRADWMEDAPLAAKVQEITRWHKQRGWNAIGYHWVIDRDGAVIKGRPETTIGAHVANHNTGSIGICLIGGFGSSEVDPFEKNFTAKQDHALRTLINDIKTRTTIKRVRGHNEVAAKACPGFNVARWLDRKPAKKSIADSTTVQASAIQIASGAGTGISAVAMLDGYAQIVAIVFAVLIVAAAAWIMRERIKRWARDNAQ